MASVKLNPVKVILANALNNLTSFKTKKKEKYLSRKKERNI